MADSILKLRVESSEYDNKLKRAAEGIKRYADSCRSAGGTLEHLDEGVLEFVQALGKMDTVATNTRGQLREMTQSLTDLTQVYRGLTDAEKTSEFGKELAKGIQTLTERAGQAKDALADVAASIQHASSDTRTFDQLSQGVGIMTSGFQTVTGAAKLFGIQMGDNVEVIAKLQAAMAVTNGLTQAQTALQKQSALMQGVMAVQAKAAAAAIALEGNSTKAATVAQAAFNAVAKANPYVLLASAVAAVGTALVGFSKNAKDAVDATKEETAAMKEASRMADIWKNAIGSTYSSLMTKYDELKRQWQSLTSEHSKTEWIKKNQSALNDLGGAVTDVKTAEDFFNNNTDAVVQSFVRRAQAAARVAQLTELYRKQIELLDKKSQVSADITSDAQRQGRSAKAGDVITDATYRSNKYGKVNSQGKWVFTEQGAKLYSGTDTSSSSSVLKVDVELQANQSEIEKVKNQITNEFSDISIDRGSGGSGGKSNNVNTKNTIAEAIDIPEGSLKALNDELKKLQEARQLLTDPIEIEIQDQQIKEVQDEIDRLNGKKVEVELEVNNKTPFEQFQQNLRIKLGEENIEVDSNTLKTLMGVAIQNNIDGLDVKFASIFENLKNGIPDETWQALLDQINEKLTELDIKPIKIDFSTGNIKKQSKEMSKDWKDAASAIQSVGSAMASIEDPAAKVVGTVAQAIASVALAAGQAMSAKDTTASGWAWIGAAAAITATMISTIASIHSATGYAQGGMIKGNSYSGDNIGGLVDGSQLVGLNAGEVVLNASQQSMLANNLQGSGGDGGYMPSHISGEQIYVVLSRFLKRTGRGELVTWK